MSNNKTTALVPASVTDAEHMAVQLSKSQLVPDAFRNKPADTFMAISYGLELGLPPVSALRSIAVIKGKPTLYADAMVGLVMASGKAEYFTCVESLQDRATYATKRKGSPDEVRKTFTTADAEQAGLPSQNKNYRTYPKQMLEARAKAWLARDVYPDLLHGIYSAEEVSEMDDTPPRPAEVAAVQPAYTDAEVVDDEPEDVAATADELRAALADCETEDDVQILLPQVQRLPQHLRDQLREPFREARNRCRQGAA